MQILTYREAVINIRAAEIWCPYRTTHLVVIMKN